MVYSWKTYGYKVPAQVVGEHLEKLQESGKAITAETVLESARDESSPIHDLFEWDDTVAAEAYRRGQASRVITNIHVEKKTTEGKTLKLRAYVDTTMEKRGTFVNIEHAFKNVDTREIVLARAYNELRAFERKYRDLQEFAELFELINRTVA